MDIVSLVRFLAIIDHRTFAAAARNLKITPQALSISVAKLEDDLGVALFDRTRGGTTQPTGFAMALTTHARAIVAAQRHAVDELHAIRDGRAGWVRLGVGESMTGSMAARAVAELKAEHPKVNIVLTEGYTTKLLEMLDHGDLDLVAGAPNHGFEPRPHLQQTLLYKSHDVVAVRQKHPLAHKKRVTLEDMRPYTWILPFARSDSYQAVLTAYLEANLSPPDNFIFSDTYTLGSYLLSQQDYLHPVSPDLLWVNELKPFFAYLKVDKPTIERHACLIHRNDLPLSAAALLLKEKLIKATARLRGR